MRARVERAKRFYHENEPACTAGLFVFGFLFDTLAVGRIDQLHNIIHQAVYLSLCALFTGLELREKHGAFTPPERLRGAWAYQAGATHFMLGTLLNIYTLFFFKSASLTASAVFLLLLVALLAVNELKPFESSGTALRMSLFSLCLLAYFTYLVPVLVGSIGTWPFLGSMAGASAAVGLFGWRLTAALPARPDAVRRSLLIPYASVMALFIGLYFAKVIPPVPLSLVEIGIYHDVRREGKDFVLSSTRPRWKFWQRGDQLFLARPGDRIHCFVSVFSPTRFAEKLTVRWLVRDPARGWAESDAIPLEIAGGRDEGWRGNTAKARYTPGDWRVLIETSDGRELGRIALKVVPDPSSAERTARILRR
ncbi:MAG: DUF2914 domain-containing protein [Elusimicrobia bacterium]|nr:DUF2914 domain-containing protein [Elusimicrobiota bacterium]